MESIVEPRDQDATLQSDWAWVRKTLQMIADRVADGGRIKIVRPSSFPKTADVVSLMRSAHYRMIDDCLKNALVVDVDEEGQEYGETPSVTGASIA